MPRDWSDIRDFPPRESAHGHSSHKLQRGVTLVHILAWLLLQLKTPTNPDTSWQPAGRWVCADQQICSLKWKMAREMCQQLSLAAEGGGACLLSKVYSGPIAHFWAPEVICWFPGSKEATLFPPSQVGLQGHCVVPKAGVHPNPDSCPHSGGSPFHRYLRFLLSFVKFPHFS